MSTDPAPRHQSRERALTLLYEAELKGERPAPTCWPRCRWPRTPTSTTLVTAVGERMDRDRRHDR